MWMPLSIQPPKSPSFSCLSVCILHFPASKGLQFCAVWCPDCQPWCHCRELSDRWRKPQTLGEKPSLSLCSGSPSSASHINTGITHMGIRSALLGWFMYWKLWKCLCSLLNQTLIYLNYTSAWHYGSRVKILKSPYWLWWPQDFMQYSAALTHAYIHPPNKFIMTECCYQGVDRYGCTLWITGMWEAKDHVTPQPPPPPCSQPWAHWAAQSTRNWAQALLYVLIQDTVSLTAPSPDKAEQSALWGELKTGEKINKEKLHIFLRFFQYVSSKMCWLSNLPPVSELWGLMKLTFLPLQCYVRLKTFSTYNRYVW